MVSLQFRGSVLLKKWNAGNCTKTTKIIRVLLQMRVTKIILVPPPTTIVIIMNGWMDL
jgi:hypothetical protein